MKPRMKRKNSDTVLVIQFVLMSNLFIEKNNQLHNYKTQTKQSMSIFENIKAHSSIRWQLRKCYPHQSSIDNNRL